jgi:hypothetical protein
MITIRLGQGVSPETFPSTNAVGSIVMGVQPN